MELLASGIVKTVLLLAAIVDEMELLMSGIVKSILLLAAVVDEMDPASSISSTIGAGSSIGLIIPDAVCTVLCS
jgi:hypothetical protein